MVEQDGSSGGALVGPSKRPALRRYLTISWVVTIVVFTLVRLLVARGTLEKYGLNIWVFGVIDLVTALPYAIGVAKVVTAMVDRQVGSAGRWAAIAAASFLAPYVYIAWAGKEGEFPPSVYFVLGGLIIVFGGNAIRGAFRKVEAVRSSRLDGLSGEHGGVESSGPAAVGPVDLVVTGISGAGPALSELVISDTITDKSRSGNEDASAQHQSEGRPKVNGESSND